jgi:hypothetical protein
LSSSSLPLSTNLLNIWASAHVNDISNISRLNFNNATLLHSTQGLGKSNTSPSPLSFNYFGSSLLWTLTRFISLQNLHTDTLNFPHPSPKDINNELCDTYRTAPYLTNLSLYDYGLFVNNYLWDPTHFTSSSYYSKSRFYIYNDLPTNNDVLADLIYTTADSTPLMDSNIRNLVTTNFSSEVNKAACVSYFTIL